MKYTLRGDLQGRLAKAIEEPLDTVDVRLYDVSGSELETDTIRKAAEARPKETFSILSETEVAEKRDALIAEGTTESDGSFSIDIDDSADFRADEQGRPDVFQIDVRVDSIPQTRAKADEPVQFTLTMHDPSWEPAEPGGETGIEETPGQPTAELEEQASQQVASYQHTISKRNWCAVLEALGVWVVCGKVHVENTTAPVENVTVTAKDADLIQHDELGSDITDSRGHFSIYYTTDDFEETPPPWGQIELIPGPDLYFSVEQEEKVFLDEPSSKGRDGGRENADHCEYVELPIDFEEAGRTDDGKPTAPTLWDSVGSAFSVPGDFDSDGYAGAERYALFRNITMEGQAPLYHRRATPTNSLSVDEFVEYRFLVAENPDASSPDFDPIGVGSSTYIDAFVDGVMIGKLLVYQSGAPRPVLVPVRIDQSHLDSDGWLSVREATNDALNTRLGTNLASLDHDRHSWFDSDELMGIDTRQFTSEPDVADASSSDPVPTAGEAVPASRQIDTEAIAIKFEARVIDANGNELANPQWVHGKTLPKAVVNNNAAFVEFTNNNHERANNKCKILSGNVDVGYTVYHPHLEGARIDVRRNSDDGSFPRSISLDDANLPYNFAAGTTGTLETAADSHFHNDSLDIPRESGGANNPILTKKCGYEASIKVRRRLHNGNTSDDWDTRGSSIFYWDGGSP